MAIKLVTAFQTSDGRCFANKDQAQQEEVNQLRQALEIIKQKGCSVQTFNKFYAEIALWMVKAEALKSELATEKPESA